MTVLSAWLGGAYFLALSGLAGFGALGLVTLWLYRRHRHETFPCPPVTDAELPLVTVQLPLFNERFVVHRLIRAAVALDYPRQCLQIQVLDDSTDDTTELAAELVQQLQQQGHNIQLQHRSERIGFKAGALEAGLESASGQFIAVFDADFIPPPDFLRRTLPHFSTDPGLGVVQARWGHLNAQRSFLTGAQSIALDKHFAMEQTVRHRADLFPKFNGSAGIWRRRCLEDAGGWEADTVTEDLCLSTRAVLRGWRFRFLVDTTAPAELPQSVAAYKNQQSRWAEGASQNLRKHGRAILVASDHSRLARLYALVSLAGYATSLLVLLLLVVQVPLIYLGFQPPAAVLAVALLGVGQPLLFVTGQRALYPDWLARLRYLPALLIVAVGLAPANARAVLKGTFGRRHIFIRTPKGEGRGYRLPFDWIVAVELLLAAYAGLGLVLCLTTANAGPLLFMLTCLLGFGYVGLASLRR
ncbi:MAG: glycosyltransferase [Candidatus Promineifilaceae bacterium]|nr:glycosyltransferase [Candidatus Promineifilaceae bacterium]